MAELTRRVFKAGGPALLFENIKGSPFQAASNIYGTIERARFVFRKNMKSTKAAVNFKLTRNLFLAAFLILSGYSLLD